MTTYRSVINNSNPNDMNQLYTLNDIINDVRQFMTNGNTTGSNGNGALDIFSQNIINLKYAQEVYSGTIYNISGYGNMNLVDLLVTLITNVLNNIPNQTNPELRASGVLTNAANTINTQFLNVIMGPNVKGWVQSQTNANYEKPPKNKRPSQNVRNNTNNGINNNFNELYNTVAQEINSVVLSYNPACNVFIPNTIGVQLANTYSTANASCAAAIQAAGEAGELAGGGNSNLLGYNDLVNYWSEINDQWLTVENEQIGTNFSENPDYITMNTNLSNINTVCSNATTAYQSYISQEMAYALTPAPVQRPPDTTVTNIINDSIAQYYQTQMGYLKGLENQLQDILNYLTALNIPTVTTSSTNGSTTVLNLDQTNVIFSAPTNPPTGIITIQGNPGQQTIKMVLSNGIPGPQGDKGPTGHSGVNGPRGKDGPIGSPGIFEIPYQYFKSF